MRGSTAQRPNNPQICPSPTFKNRWYGSRHSDSACCTLWLFTGLRGSSFLDLYFDRHSLFSFREVPNYGIDGVKFKKYYQILIIVLSPLILTNFSSRSAQIDRTCSLSQGRVQKTARTGQYLRQRGLHNLPFTLKFELELNQA